MRRFSRAGSMESHLQAAGRTQHDDYENLPQRTGTRKGPERISRVIALPGWLRLRTAALRLNENRRCLKPPEPREFHCFPSLPTGQGSNLIVPPLLSCVQAYNRFPAPLDHDRDDLEHQQVLPPPQTGAGRVGEALLSHQKGKKLASSPNPATFRLRKRAPNSYYVNVF